MASIDPQGRFGYFDWISICKVPSCPYNISGVRVSSWWLFLCLSYISCFLVGIIFTVAGFASMGNEMAAVGVVSVIVGSCLAIVCDVLRRLGCGWTKTHTESAHPRQIAQENATVELPIPFLPGYPGFCTAGEDIRPDNPPPYVISQGCDSPDDPIARPYLSFSCRSTSANVNGSAKPVSVSGCENPCGRLAMTLEASGERSPRTENLSAAAIVLVSPTGIEHGTLSPPPPPYDFETTDSEDGISWLYDTPPPYGDLV